MANESEQQRRRPGREVITWDEYLLSLARAASVRSRDPDTQVGCVIADRITHRIVATGYNGPPPGMDDDLIDWSRPNKYDVVIHAEANAILHATLSDLSNCDLYVTGKPCSACMRLIVAKRIRRVVYTPMLIKMCDEAEWEKTKRIADWCGVGLEEFQINSEGEGESS